MRIDTLPIPYRLVPFYTHKLTRILMSVKHGPSFFSFSYKCKSRWSHSVSQLKPILSKECSACHQFSCCRFVQKLESKFVKKTVVYCFIRIKNRSIKPTVRPKHNKQLAVPDNAVTNLHVWCAFVCHSQFLSIEHKTRRSGAMYTHSRHLTKTVFA